MTLLAKLAETHPPASVPPEEAVDSLLAAIRERFRYRAWVVERIEGKGWEPTPLIDADSAMMRALRVFSPAASPGYKTEETNALLELIKDESLLDYWSPPTDAVLPALRSLEEAERWRIYTSFFSLVNGMSRAKRLRPAGGDPIAADKIIRFAEADATLADSDDDMLAGGILEMVANDLGKYKSRLGARGKP